MRQHLGSLCLRQAIVHGAVQVVSDLCHLPRSDQRANRYKAAITRCQRWPQPELTEQQVRGVLDESGRDRAEVVVDLRGSLGLGLFIPASRSSGCAQ